MKALRWLTSYWYIPVLIATTIAGWIFWNRWFGNSRTPPFQQIADKLAVIEAGRTTRETILRDGEEEAQRLIAEKYQAKRAALDAEAEAQVKELENDPVALARMLERLTR